MPHSRSPRTSHGGQTYPEKEKVKPAVSQGHWMTNDLETQVLIPEFSMDPCAFKGTGAQLLPLVSSQGGGQFVLRNMPAVTCSSTGCSTAAQVPTQSLTDQGPRGKVWCCNLFTGPLQSNRGQTREMGTTSAAPQTFPRLEAEAGGASTGPSISSLTPHLCMWDIPLGSLCRAHQLHRTGSASHRC